MRLTITCTKCKMNVGVLDLEDPRLVAAGLVMAHGGAPHSGHHTLEAYVDGVDVASASGDVEVTIKCLQLTTCKDRPPSVFRVRSEWVPAVALLHHTSHEGHPFEMTIDGKLYSLPQPPLKK
jgi:hypothetical protein